MVCYYIISVIANRSKIVHLLYLKYICNYILLNNTMIQVTLSSTKLPFKYLKSLLWVFLSETHTAVVMASCLWVDLFNSVCWICMPSDIYVPIHMTILKPEWKMKSYLVYFFHNKFNLKALQVNYNPFHRSIIIIQSNRINLIPK